MKFHRIKTIVCRALLIFCLFQSCGESFEYSPNQTFDSSSPSDLNAKNLSRLCANPTDDTITIAFVGDSQRFYEELDDFVKKVNSITSVDFILLDGDITDWGLLEEYKLIASSMSLLTKPYIAVIGNHDLQANGLKAFKKMFGPTNFSFVYQDVKFVCHDTNSKEYSAGMTPDIAWLKRELGQTEDARYFIPVSHVPPFSNDFDKQLEESYTSILNETPDVLLSLHAHVHKFTDGYYYNDHVRYMTSFCFKQKSFVLLKICNGKISHSLITY